MLELNYGRISHEGITSDSWLDLPEERTYDTAFDLGAALEAPMALETSTHGEVLFEKTGSMEEILKELAENGYSPLVFPNFNYELGLACLKLSLIDEAIAQLEIAVETGQNPGPASHYLAVCYKEKGLLDEAQKFFDQAQDLGGLPEEDPFESGSEGFFAGEDEREMDDTEVFSVDTLSLADLEIQKRLAPYRSCLKLPQGYSV